jgi:hypothetical protein
VAQGVPHEGWIVNFASVLERILPDKGKLMAHLFLRQAVTYINDKVLAHIIGRPPMSTNSFLVNVSPRMRVPSPPQKITTGISFIVKGSQLLCLGTQSYPNIICKIHHI